MIKKKRKVPDLIFDDRADAMDALKTLNHLIIQYGSASVVDMYKAAGMSTTNTDDIDYGWTSPIYILPEEMSEGHILRFPQPKSLVRERKICHE